MLPALIDPVNPIQWFVVCPVAMSKSLERELTTRPTPHVLIWSDGRNDHGMSTTAASLCCDTHCVVHSCSHSLSLSLLSSFSDIDTLFVPCSENKPKQNEVEVPSDKFLRERWSNSLVSTTSNEWNTSPICVSWPSRHRGQGTI